jgi:hypothetical protein
MEELLKALLQNGPGFVLAAVMLWLYIGQRNDYKELVKEQKESAGDLTKLVRESVESDTQHRNTITQLLDAQKSVDQRLEDLARAMSRLPIDEDLTGPVRR